LNHSFLLFSSIYQEEKMANPRVAEMREKFLDTKIMGLRPIPPNLGSRGRSEDHSPTDEPRRGSGSQTNEINQSIPNKSDESMKQEIVATPHRVLPTPGKKPPVPLPKPVLHDRNDRPADTISYESFDRNVEYDLPSEPLDPTGGRKVHISPSNTIPRYQNDHVNVTTEPPSTVVSSLVKGISKLPVTLPTSTVSRDRTESLTNEFSSSSSSSMVSLGDQLPSRCTFLDFDTMLDQYRKRDPQTILYSRKKPVVPMMTTNEMDILRRLSNTHH